MQIHTRAFGGFADTGEPIRNTGLSVTAPDRCQVWRDQDTFMRLHNCRCDQIGPGHRAKFFMKQTEPRGRTRRHDGGIANLASKIIKQAIAGNRCATLTVFLPHIRAHVRARAVIKIDHPACAGCCMKVVQGPHAAQAAHKRVIDHLRESRCQRSIKSVTAALKNLCPHLGSTRLRTHDNTFHAVSPFCLEQIPLTDKLQLARSRQSKPLGPSTQVGRFQTTSAAAKEIRLLPCDHR